MSQLTVASSYSGRWDTWGIGSWNEWLNISSQGGSNGEIGMRVKHCDGTNQDKWEVKVGFAQFNTSGLPDDCTIHSAYLHCRMGWNNESFSGPGIAISTMSAGNRYDGAIDEYNTGNLIGDITNAGSGWYNLNINNPNSNISKTSWSKYHFGTQQSMSRVSPGPAAPYPGQDDYYIMGNDSADNITIVITYTVVPTITTGSATSVEATTAILGGNVTSDGGGTISARGVCWSTSANPTTLDSKETTTGTTGTFTVNATNLTKNTTYHFRAYVTTENSTQYGSDETFQTDVEPSVTTNAMTAIGGSRAVGNGNVTSAGGGTVSETGFCYSLIPNPTTSSSKTVAGSGTGVFSATITGLLVGKKYYLRAYAINGAGTGYGSEISFKTICGGAFLYNFI